MKLRQCFLALVFSTSLAIQAEQPFCPYGVDVISGMATVSSDLMERDSSGRIVAIDSIQTFNYQDFTTETSDGCGNRTVYRHNGSVVEGIATYDAMGQLHSSEELLWSEDGQFLLKHSVLNGDGSVLRSLSYEYDDRGLLASETITGCLTGQAETPEKYTTRFEYTNIVPHRISRRSEDNGSTTDYEYDERGLLLSKISQREGSSHRQYFIHNEEGVLTETVIDDGTDNRKKRVVFYPSLEKPESIVEYRVNQGVEEVVRRIENGFSEETGLTFQELFDSQDISQGFRSFMFDAKGNSTGSIDHEGNGINNSYDEEGNKLSVTEFKNNKIVDQKVYTYNGSKLPVTTETLMDNGSLAQSLHEYDNLGRCIATIDPIGNKTEYRYDPQGRITDVIYPRVLDADDQVIQPRQKWHYDALGRVIRTSDLRGDVMAIQYTSRDQPCKICYPDGSCDIFEYRLDGTLKKAVSRYGCTTEYDHQGSAIMKAASGEVVDPGMTKQEKQTEEPSTPEETSLFINSRVKTDELGQQVLEATTVDEQGNVSIVTLDACGRVAHVIKKNLFGEVTLDQENRYDAMGNKTLERHFVNQPNGVETSLCTRWEYGPESRLEKVYEAYSLPEQKVTSYHYLDDGRLSHYVKPDGVAVYHEYGPTGLLARLWSSDLSIDYQLSYSDNKISAIIDSVGGQNSTHHDGREVLGNGFAITCHYNEDDQRTFFQLPDGSGFKYDWIRDELKAIHRVDAAGSVLYTSNGENLIGELGKLTLAIDDKGFCREITSSYWAESVLENGLSDGKMHSCVISDSAGTVTEHYEYDDRNRVVAEEGAFESHYTYDALGNRYSGSSEQYNMLNQLIAADGVQYRYDFNGNLIAKNEVTYSYDALDRLTQVATPDGKRYQYTYDYFNRRLSKTVYDNENIEHQEFYLYDGFNEIGAIDGEGKIFQLRMLGQGIGAEIGATKAIELNGKVFAPIHDHRGSISCLVSLEKNKAVECYRFSAFGEEQMWNSKGKKIKSSRVGNPWRFSGKRVDPETGFVYFGKRYYQPAEGRWTTPDPIGFIEGVNRYQFAGNNPVTSVDLHGLFSIQATWNSIYNACDSFFTRAWEVAMQVDQYIRDNFSLTKHLMPTIDHIANDALGEVMLVLIGYYHEEPEVCVYGQGELSDKVRVTVINGILNISTWAENNAKLLSMTHSDINIHYIFRPTRGWTQDLIKSGLVKFGYASEESRLLARTWKNLIQEMGGAGNGGMIVHYAHSIGGADTAIARKFLTLEEQKMIRVISLGSPLMIPHVGFHSVINYMSMRDGLFLLAPLSHISNFFSKNHNVIYLDSYWGIPFVDHLLNHGTYATLLQTLGREFIEEFLTQKKI